MSTNDDQSRARIADILQDSAGHVAKGRHIVNQLDRVLELVGIGARGRRLQECMPRGSAVAPD
jgi:hypothetical protein